MLLVSSYSQWTKEKFLVGLVYKFDIYFTYIYKQKTNQAHNLQKQA